ncbi:MULTISPECIES: hypothetical protein [Propionispora]|uniref:Uncharacterized protein n=2 Tax=Propionispora TaxID=112902 RepID=A0A1H8XIJ1_9FIRM|nr:MULTISPECIES: hypothetical protein [Propionispora]SEP39854.1 hypothetical protein SAMN04490178_12473 [Propionispora vibrioides]SHJ87126.1 hypothetical protein SAMN02745170_03546 [Propionispora hippei DSM 15287]
MKTQPEIVWIVSFGIGEDGGFINYLVEQADLSEYPKQTADTLRNKIGEGVFYSSQEAETWGEEQMQGRECGCTCKKGCCKQKK